MKRAIMAIAHTLLKIAYQVLSRAAPPTLAPTSTPAGNPQARQVYLIRQLQKLNPGCVITVTQRRLPDGPGLIPDRPPGRRPPPADGTTAAGC